jgi:uncharacterized protein (TIGR03435 family)
MSGSSGIKLYALGAFWLSAAAIGACCLAQAPTSAQTTVRLPVFDIASVKPMERSERSGTDFTMRGGEDGVKLSIRYATLIDCIERAYGVKEYQVSGPDWLKSNRYEIIATAPRVGPKQIWLMLQSLLADRFSLTLHRETKELPVYELVIGKKGFKMHESRPDDQSGSGIGGGNGKLHAKKQSMAQFAEFLSHQMDRPVLDSTGLTGLFDFEMEFAREETAPLFGDKATTSEPSAPPIPVALRAQLGLELKAGKAPIEILVIDSANKMPTPN